jgi:hypothetical protein
MIRSVEKSSDLIGIQTHNFPACLRYACPREPKDMEVYSALLPVYMIAILLKQCACIALEFFDVFQILISSLL